MIHINNGISVTLKEKGSTEQTEVSGGVSSWRFQHSLWLPIFLFYLEICRRLVTMGQFFDFWNFGTKLLQLQLFILDFRL